jgi:DNA polymerase II small subunit/DNA polymerase delta subunit B
MAFKMKGHTLPGINQRMDKSSLEDGRAKSSAFQKDKDKSVSEKQTVIDEKNISENTNQPVQGMISNADHKENVKSVKRQNRINTQKMSRKEIQNELKKRKKEGVNKSEKLDVGLLGRVFGGKKKLASKLSHQKNVSDI